MELMYQLKEKRRRKRRNEIGNSYGRDRAR